MESHRKIMEFWILVMEFFPLSFHLYMSRTHDGGSQVSSFEKFVELENKCNLRLNMRYTDAIYTIRHVNWWIEGVEIN
jgi:hypothetical protein